MDTTQASLNPSSIDWQSEENHVLLNPRWPAPETRGLTEVADVLTRQNQLRGHVWLATSGSTSESTGFIKLVALSKKAFLVSARAVNEHLLITSEDVWLQVLPKFHVGGLGVEVRAQLSQSRVVPDFEKWDPERAHRILSQNKITVASFVPTQVFDLVQARLASPRSLRAVIVGGGALNESLYRAARNLGWPLLPSYGMTETCSQIATAPLGSLQGTVMPRAQKLNHVQWRTTVEGLLQVSGESLLSYYGQRKKDGSIHGWDPKIQTWFTTEDVVQLQGAEICFTGRKNDFLKIGGESTSLGRLREIFDRVLLQQDPSVSSQVVLMDAPSNRLGVEIHLITTLAGRSDEDTAVISRLQESFNREVLPFERIREVKYTQNIPRSELGKVLMAQLKKELYGP